MQTHNCEMCGMIRQMTMTTRTTPGSLTTLRLLPILLIFAIALACGTAAPTARIPQDTANATRGWLQAFSHANPEYVDKAQSAYAFAGDGEFCAAAAKFDDIVNDARDRDGSRMPIASYNAAVLYMIVREIRDICPQTKHRESDTVPRPLYALEYMGSDTVPRLLYALQYMPDDSLDANIHFLLGFAYFTEWDRTIEGSGSQIKLSPEALRKRAVIHSCTALAMDPGYTDQVNDWFYSTDYNLCDPDEDPSTSPSPAP